MGKKKQEAPSEVLTGFLNYIDQCKCFYESAFDSVGTEDKRLQDLLHELEFAPDENNRRRAATKLQQSRRNRRKQKDEVQKYKLIVEFFEEPENKRTLNKMQQLLGRQRKQEEYLDGERHYNKRAQDLDA